MSNSDLTLHHFDERGRAEVSRLILTLAGKSFKTMRYNFQEWPAVKPTMPFGQLPVLEVDGIKFCQGLAIAAYLAKEFGFYGQTNLERLKIDAISQLVFEFRSKASAYYYGNDGKNNPKIGKTITQEYVPKYLDNLQQLLVEEGGQFLAGNCVTLADITLFDMFTGFLGDLVTAAATNYPLLTDHVERIGNIESIKNYCTSRK